ncbi:MAG: Exodeoxyribonuclease III [Rhodocyclaceae bacterium]|nr:MAG: exodeoxyribonuclease III [Rhodocyclaceae bacterium]MBE7420963.1 exodeoxyribonuclease III [Zoogloeaceae bacterium]MBV6408829.1 Exodeoxyribonuclease III [Rhodocyclaceae bacterium]MCK6384958.1 exodeoxyribonuclease III [Rhodocyclaceae bacterium]CAG0945821.1 Exodeoxyribonuclease III [Gammaproteobacteria bacterium]
MKLATWNVNSLKVRLPQLLDWLAAQHPDVVCLQETKLEDKAFPRLEFESAGYRAAFAGQKTYNGVAILSRLQPPADVSAGIPGFADAQQRLIAATIDGMRIVCAYFPNGQSVGSDKYAYKLKWVGALTAWLESELARHPRLALLGDYNIAPEEPDVHDPQAWEGQVLFSEPERTAFRRLLDLGLKDAFRLFDQPEKTYTWWDYRMMAFRRNRGLRIDHILLSQDLARDCTACRVDKEARRAERPSDHAPVIAELK